MVLAPIMPTTESLNQGIQYANNPIQSPQLQGSPSQHSPMGEQSQTAPNLNPGGGDENSQILSRSRLRELVREVDPTMQLDEEVEDILLQFADDFIDTALAASCSLAKHRNAPHVEIRDVQLHLASTGRRIGRMG